MNTMISPLRRAVTVGAARTAVTCGEVQLTYAVMMDRCRRLAGALESLGMRPGDRIAVVGGNCHRYLELYQAVPSAGLCIVPLNPRHTPVELRYAIEDAGARVLFTSIGDQGLGDILEHVFDLGEGYESLIANASPADF